MSAGSKLKAAAITAGTALAALGAWFGLKAHDEHIREEERERLQQQYLSAKALGNGALEEKNAEIRAISQDLGKFNPDGNWGQRFRKANAGVGANTQEPEDIVRQPEYIP